MAVYCQKTLQNSLNCFLTKSISSTYTWVKFLTKRKLILAPFFQLLRLLEGTPMHLNLPPNSTLKPKIYSKRCLSNLIIYLFAHQKHLSLHSTYDLR